MHETMLAVLSCYLVRLTTDSRRFPSSVVPHESTFPVSSHVSPVTLSLDSVLVAARDLDLLCWTQAIGLVTLHR